MNNPRPTRRSLLLGGVLVAAATLPGCSPDPPRPRDGDLRTRLIAALRPDHPTRADLVANPHTDLTPVPAGWLPGWAVVDVLARIVPHPRRFYAALSDDGRVEVLTGRPERFSHVLVDAGVRIDTATVATGVAVLYLDATRDFLAYAYRIEGIDDIEWLSRLTPAEQARRDAVVATYRRRIRPVRAETGREGWRVRAWLVQGRDLVEHRLTLLSARPVVDDAGTRERDLPVPYSY